MGSILCEHCTAACCRYIAIPIDTPKNKRDYDDIRWYLMHEGITVFVEEDEWYCQFQTTCRNLGLDNRCTVYDTRPEICAEYKAQDCDYVGGTYGYEQLFTHPKAIEDYYFEKTGRKLGTSREQQRLRIGPKLRRKKKSSCDVAVP